MTIELKYNIGDRVQFNWLAGPHVGTITEGIVVVTDKTTCIHYEVRSGEQWYRVAEELITAKLKQL